jgi:actin-related protein 6
MARGTKAASSASVKPTTLVLDNGGWTLKAGLVGSGGTPSSSDCTIIPNCVARGQDKKVYVGAQLDRCRDFYHITLRRPMERGMVVNWELERAIWHNSFISEKENVLGSKGEDGLGCDPHETNLVLGTSPNTFPALETNCDQMVFEEFEFASYYRCVAPEMNAYQNMKALASDGTAGESEVGIAQCVLVVDSGYSHTTVTPLLNGRPIQSAIRRLDVGGKHLTNYLTELLAIHEISLKDDPWIANEVKEATCFVTDDFNRDMERTWRGHKMDPSIVLDCQLPDYVNNFKVIVQPYEVRDQFSKNKSSIMTVGNERFQVPEIIFRPTDVGMVEPGLPELIVQCISLLPEGLRPLMLGNIMVVGGNAKISGFLAKLEKELRQLAPADYPVKIISSEDPITSTWLGGARLASDQDLLKERLVTREQYLEHGPNWLMKKFNGQDP